jgi:hypothetical protein
VSDVLSVSDRALSLAAAARATAMSESEKGSSAAAKVALSRPCVLVIGNASSPFFPQALEAMQLVMMRIVVWQ